MGLLGHSKQARRRGHDSTQSSVQAGSSAAVFGLIFPRQPLPDDGARLRAKTLEGTSPRISEEWYAI
jgi:hypothetical protein